jgi:protein O-mannosyl-transferase
VTLPFVLLLLDYWPLTRFGQATSVRSKARWRDRVERGLPPPRLILEKIPLIALSAISATITLFAQGQALGWTEDLPVSSRLNNAVVTYITYIWQMLWPVKLAVFYPHPESRLALGEVILALAALIAITVAAFGLRRSRPYFITGWLWYLGMLVPVIGVIQVGWQGRADRYTYLPQIGLYVSATWALRDLSASWRYQRQIAGLGAAILLGALAWRAWNQASFWRDSETLWTHALMVTSDNDVAENNLGIVFLGRGQLNEAISRFQAAVDLRTENAPAHDNLANALLQKGQLADAILHYRKLLEIQPDNVEAHNILGAVLIQQGRVKEAIEQWQETLAIRPENGNAKSNLAWVFATYPEESIRDGTRAVQLAEQAVQLSGGKNPIVLRTLAAAYAESGHFEEAIETAQRASELTIKQGNAGLAAELQRNIALYRMNSPLRDTGPASANH